MYGIILEPVKQYILEMLGEETWIWLCKTVIGDEIQIETRKSYPDHVLPAMVLALCKKFDLDSNNLLYDTGRYTIQYLVRNGYNKLLRVLGRNFKEFLYNINDHHEYLRLSYHQIKPPCFIVLSSTPQKIYLKYSTKRPGYVPYVKGLLVEIAEYFYQLNLIITSEPSIETGQVTQTIFILELENGEYFKESPKLNENFYDDSCNHQFLFANISSKTFFEIIPFHLLLNRKLIIKSAGHGLLKFDSYLINSKFKNKFAINRPYVAADFEKIVMFRFCTFKILLKVNENKASRNQQYNILKLKGEMFFIEEWDMLLFIGRPNIMNVKALMDSGLHLYDLNLYDGSRDAVIQGDEPSEEILHLLEKQTAEIKQLGKTAKKLEIQRRKTNELLYQCLPREVAEQISQGVSLKDTIKTYDSVTICFTKVVNFSIYCSRLSAQKIVGILNHMYTLYDALTESHNVYKVETIGDSYMLVSGAPNETKLHFAHIIEIALDILQSTKHYLYWPNENTDNQLKHSKSNEPLQLFIGCHTGSIVAGIVGYKTPRYCLFGDTVNTSSRMMSSSVPDKIHISSALAEKLAEYPYRLESRGEMTIKGKGVMTTYFVLGRQQQFVKLDSATGKQLNFKDILKEDNKLKIHEPTERDSPDQISELSETEEKSSPSSDGGTVSVFEEGEEQDNDDDDDSNNNDYVIEQIPLDTNENQMKSRNTSIVIEHELYSDVEKSFGDNNQNLLENQIISSDKINSSNQNSEKSIKLYGIGPIDIEKNQYCSSASDKKISLNSPRNIVRNLSQKNSTISLFKPLTNVSFTSKRSQILQGLADPLSIGLTELALVQPNKPIQYLSNWLSEFAKRLDENY